MKTPRVSDFDPSASLPLLGSPLDQMPAIHKPQPKEQSAVVLSERPNARTLQRPNGKRIITRNSFEIYEDQMDSLRRLAYEEKMEGRLGSMSQMVRDAIDTYLSERKHSSSKPERPNE